MSTSTKAKPVFICDTVVRKATVIGAGISGLAAFHLLQKLGVLVFISDTAPAETVLQKAQKIGIHLPASAFEAGGHTQRVFDADILVRSPGISTKHPVILQAFSRGIRVITEIDLAAQFLSAPCIGVTGSVGKTTIVSMINAMGAFAQKEFFVGGNIGIALSSLVEKVTPNDIVVAELSSFQLEQNCTFRPEVAIIATLQENHIDYHGSFERYIEAKLQIYAHMQADDHLIVDATDPRIISALAQNPPPCQIVSIKPAASLQKYVEWEQECCYLYTPAQQSKKKLFRTQDVVVPGMHNIHNAAYAACAARLMGVSTEVIQQGLSSFCGVEHRIEFRGTRNGVRFYNDSKSTTPASIVAAISAFNDPMVVIAGGKNKGLSFASVGESIANKPVTFVLFGQDAADIERAIKPYGTYWKVDTLEAAIDKAIEVAEKARIVLFSPGCASFDMFENFEHRGQVFCELLSAKGVQRNA